MNKAQESSTNLAQLKRGVYMYFADCKYLVLECGMREVEAQDLATGQAQNIPIADLYAKLDKRGHGVTFAETLDGLEALLKAWDKDPLPALSEEIGPRLLKRAKFMFEVAELIERRMVQKRLEHQQSRDSHDNLRSEADGGQRENAQRNDSRRVSIVEETCLELRPEIHCLRVKYSPESKRSDKPETFSYVTFYQWRDVVSQNRVSGNERETIARIAASLERPSRRKKRLHPAQVHLIEYMIRDRPESRGLNCSQAYEDLKVILRRTRGWWINPEKCGKLPPPALLSQLTRTDVPIEALRSNDDYKGLLDHIDPPIKSTFYRYYEGLANSAGLKKLNVVKENEEEDLLQVFLSFAHQASYSLQYVFIDHHILDLYVLEGQRPVRLWFSVAIDAFSRAILGRWLSEDDPSIWTMVSLLRHTIWPKTWPDYYGLADAWDCFGMPVVLSLDNALAHHATTIERIVEVWNSTGYSHVGLEFRPVHRPNFGGIIERYFGDVSQRFKKLPGGISGGTSEANAGARARARIIVERLDQLIHLEILHYLHHPHSELDQMTPHEKFVQGLQGIPSVPPMTQDMERVFWRWDPHPRVITSKGICAFGMHYISSALNHLPRKLGRQTKVKYEITYDPNDISKIAVFRNGSYQCDASAKELLRPDGSTRPLGLVDRGIAARLEASRSTPRNTEGEHRIELREIIKRQPGAKTEPKPDRAEGQAPGRGSHVTQRANIDLSDKRWREFLLGEDED